MLHVHLERSSPRKHYVVRQALGRIGGMDLHFEDDPVRFDAWQGPKLSYGSRARPGAFHVPEMDPESGENDSLGDPARPGDPFHAIFQCLAVPQQQSSGEVDAHGRPFPDHSFVVRNGLQHAPWVDRWALGIAAALQQRFPGLKRRERRFTHVLTVDMDNGLKYAGRGLGRAIGASLKDLLRGDAGTCIDRWRVRTGMLPDPYAKLPETLAKVSGLVDRTIVFFLLRGGRRFDHAADIRHPAYRKLLLQLADQAEVGLHPSYDSSLRRALIVEEQRELEQAADQRVRVSRQHFLKSNVPALRALVQQGMQEEHSIGFTERAGFRAATCTPFPWYDQELERETQLQLWPFATMDSALHAAGRADARQALRQMKAVCDEVKRVDGTFISVWHDRFLSGEGPFSGWPEALSELAKYART